jgi:3-oxoacyl-[acyl-carrier-protein] synthase-3
MTASIVGIGTWLPDTVRKNDAWPDRFMQRGHAKGDRTFNDIPPSEDPVAQALVERHLAAEMTDPFLGASQRHVADDSTTAADAETNAALRALRDAGIAPGDVDLLLSYSTVPDRVLQPTGPEVAYRIGAHRARALGIDTACASSIGQLEIARAYVTAGLAKVVLLVQSHLLLRTIPFEHPATPGLGDAASAMIVARGPGLSLRGTFSHSSGEFADAVTWLRGTDETPAPWWKAGADFRLGSRAPALAKVLMRDTVTFGVRTLREAAANASVDLARVSVLASVQPRGFLPGAIAECAGLSGDSAVTTFSRIAHVGACGPVFNLAQARDEGRLQKGAWVALYGQGAGFTRSAAILELTA